MGLNDYSQSLSLMPAHEVVKAILNGRTLRQVQIAKGSVRCQKLDALVGEVAVEFESTGAVCGDISADDIEDFFADEGVGALLFEKGHELVDGVRTLVGYEYAVSPLLQQ